MLDFSHTFESGGKNYKLNYTFKARRMFERQTKRSVPLLMKQIQEPETQTAENMVEVFRMLLRNDQPKINPDEVAEIIDDLGERKAMALMVQCLKDMGGGDDEPNP